MAYKTHSELWEGREGVVHLDSELVQWVLIMGGALAGCNILGAKIFCTGWDHDLCVDMYGGVT